MKTRERPSWRLAAVVAAIVVTALTFRAAPLSAQNQSDEAARVRELAERALLPQSYPSSGYGYGPTVPQEEPSVELLVGRLPTDPALDLPIPAGGRLIGTVVRRGGSYGYSGIGGTEIVIDAPGAVAEVAGFYERALQERGWSSGNVRMGGGGGGFRQPMTTQQTYLCRDEDNASLTLRVEPRSGRPNLSDVRITIGGSAPPCYIPAPPDIASIGRPYPSSPYGSSPYGSLPTLYPPEGVQLIPGVSMGGSSGGISAEARAITSMSAAELESGFGRQLGSAGWSRVGGGVAGPIAWSAWSISDQPEYQGLLMVREGLGENQRLLTLRMDAESIDLTSPQYSSGYSGYGVASPVYVGPSRPAGPASGPGGFANGDGDE